MEAFYGMNVISKGHHIERCQRTSRKPGIRKIEDEKSNKRRNI